MFLAYSSAACRSVPVAPSLRVRRYASRNHLKVAEVEEWRDRCSSAISATFSGLHTPTVGDSNIVSALPYSL